MKIGAFLLSLVWADIDMSIMDGLVDNHDDQTHASGTSKVLIEF